MISSPEVNFDIYNNSVKSRGNTAAFTVHGKIENQDIFVRTCLCFNPSDVMLVGTFSKLLKYLLIPFIQLCCVTNCSKVFSINIFFFYKY